MGWKQIGILVTLLPLLAGGVLGWILFPIDVGGHWQAEDPGRVHAVGRARIEHARGRALDPRHRLPRGLIGQTEQGQIDGRAPHRRRRQRLKP